MSKNLRNKLFGLNIYNGSYVEFITESLMTRGYSCFLNSHMLYEFNRNSGYDKVLSNANYILPDGMPVLYSVKILENKDQERIAGNDVIFSLIKECANRRLKVFVIGSTDEVLRKISEKMDRNNVVYSTYSPPYQPISSFNFDEQADMINRFGADVVFVGLGCPKQEQWMYEMKDRINVSMYGLGGAFLLYAGLDTRAPKWMRKFAMEWIYRLALEPRRLFKRYFITNTYFCFVLVKELIKRNFYK